MRFRKLRYQLLAVVALVLASGTLTAQEPTAVEPQETHASILAVDSAVLGARRGIEAARRESTTGWIWGGFLGGATLGPIGAGLVWTLANNSDVALDTD